MAKRTNGVAESGEPIASPSVSTGIANDARADSTIDVIANNGNGIDTDSGIPFVDPAGLGGSDGSGDGGSGPVTKRGRGRPAGSGAGRKATQKETAQSAVGIEKLLFSMHTLIANAIDVEELKLDKTQAKELAEGLTNVSQHYATEINPKVTAWLGLVGVIGAIYGPMIYNIRQNKKPGAKKEKALATVSSFDPSKFGNMQ